MKASFFIVYLESENEKRTGLWRRRSQEMMKKHAYLIMAHANPGQLRKLLMLLDDPRNDIFMHIDRKAGFDGNALDGICSRARLEVLKDRLTVHWYGSTILKCELVLLKAATRAGQYDYYHLLSGMDLPIKDQDTIHTFFDTHGGSEFVCCSPALNPEFEYRVRYTPFPELERLKIFHKINRFCRKVQKKLDINFHPGTDYRYGSNWFSITDSLARYTVSKEDEILHIFGHTILCDEIFLQTIVAGSQFMDRIYRLHEPDHMQTGNMRMIDWSHEKDAKHPWTFRTADMDRLMASRMLWARKFDERVDNKIIDMVCHRLKPDRFPEVTTQDKDTK